MKCTSKQAELETQKRGGGSKERERESDKGIVRLHVPVENDRGGGGEERRKFVGTSLRGRLVRRHDSWNNGFGKFLKFQQGLSWPRFEENFDFDKGKEKHSSFPSSKNEGWGRKELIEGRIEGEGWENILLIRVTFN